MNTKYEIRLVLDAKLMEAIAAYRQQRKLETGKLMMNQQAVVELLRKATEGIEMDGPATVAEFRAELSAMKERITAIEVAGGDSAK